MSENTERDELAGIVDDRWHGYGYNPQGAADAILAAGYRKTEPKWADTLTNDGTYEYTVSSDCDGSSVTHWRRTPGKMCIEDASPWEAYEPEASL